MHWHKCKGFTNYLENGWTNNYWGDQNSTVPIEYNYHTFINNAEMADKRWHTQEDRSKQTKPFANEPRFCVQTDQVTAA